MQSSNIIRFNVGGEIFCVARLTDEKSAFLCALIETKEDGSCLTDNSEEIFIDADKGAFHHILHWLRKREIYLQDEGALRNLRTEAIFFQMDDLKAAIDEWLRRVSSKTTYLLMEPEEFMALSQIDTSRTYMHSSNGIGPNYRFITCLNYTEQVWKCPRGTGIHTAPYRCGRQCNRVEECNHTRWVFENRRKYLVVKDD